MNKQLQKSKTLSGLGRLATLSTIKENLRVKTTFQKQEDRHQPHFPNGGSGDTETPQLLFSAISNYAPEKTLRPATASGRDGPEKECVQCESSNDHSCAKSTHGSTSPRQTFDLNGRFADESSAGHNGQVASNPPEAVGSGNRFKQNPECKSRLHRSRSVPLYGSRDDCDESEAAEVVLLCPMPSQSIDYGKGVENVDEALDLINGLEEAEIETFQVGGISDEEILSSVSRTSSVSRSSSALVSYRDDGEHSRSAVDDDFHVDYVYWSTPPEVPGLAIDERDLSTDDKWIPRHPDLVRVKGHPFTAEAPLTTLMHFGFLTPTALHFVHNHAAVPQAGWDDWAIHVTGLVKTPKKLSMRELLLFPSRRLPVTLMCSGNRGKELGRAGGELAESGDAAEWGAGAVSTAVWGGANLRDVLRDCGAGAAVRGHSAALLKSSGALAGGGLQQQHYFVRLLGADGYGTSIPLHVALDESRDVLLAYEQNMAHLAPDHGFPVRLIVPGFAAARSVKWLQRIDVTDEDSGNPFHVHENRMLPSHVRTPREALDGGWMQRSEFLIGEMNVTSVISSPAHNSIILSAAPSNPMREYGLRGYAYSGAGKKISRVEASLNGGKSWRLCNIECQERPNKFGKYWCWCVWELDVALTELSFSAEIVTRAWDCAMNSQPEAFAWNMLRVMNNCWYRVKIMQDGSFDSEDEPSTLTFEHPTQPGSYPGGWVQEATHTALETEETVPANFSRLKFSSSLDRKELSLRTTPRPWLI